MLDKLDIHALLFKLTVSMKYFLVANGTVMSILGLIIFYYFQKTNTSLARLGMILLIIGCTQIFWHFMWLH